MNRQVVSEDTSNSPIVRSALWAAWGDALGFPCELVDERMLKKRLPGGFDGNLHAWTRRIGGRMGAMIELPAGCTSDDTQLRLATSRCIRSSGRFDAEAFSKIELPVFLSYQLGAGKGTKTAAQSLSRRDSRWYSNFFEKGSQLYVNGGGNGAAMRIQPHVWAASKGKAGVFMPPLLRDTISTHGHLKGILGAALHGVALWTTLKEGEISSPNRWLGMVNFLEVVDKSFASDEMLDSRWIPAWEQKTNLNFSRALSSELLSLREMVNVAIKHANSVNGRSSEEYLALAKEIGGLSPSTRGAGTISAILALWLAWTHREDPATAVATCASCLGSDTDTVATMVGALVGAVATLDPPEKTMDYELIVNDAIRLERLSEGETLQSFPHPDTLHWQSPSSLSDALGTINGRTMIAGLGPVSIQKQTYTGQGKNAGIWQWVNSEYGQTFLIKRRAKLPELPLSNAPRLRPAPTTSEVLEKKPDVHVAPSSEENYNQPDKLPLGPESGIEFLIQHELDSTLLSRLLVHYAEIGSAPAASFAILFSEHLRSLPNSSMPRQALRNAIATTSTSARRSTSQGEKSAQVELTLPPDITNN